jgi:hypothetical protein
MRIDVTSRRPALGWGSGGLSGPALKAIALRMVYQVARALDIPIIGCGGVMCAEDAMEFLMAGASAVQVGTATFLNPSAPLGVIEGIEEFMRREHIEDIGEIVGIALPDRGDRRRASSNSAPAHTSLTVESANPDPPPRLRLDRVKAPLRIVNPMLTHWRRHSGEWLARYCCLEEAVCFFISWQLFVSAVRRQGRASRSTFSLWPPSAPS